MNFILRSSSRANLQYFHDGKLSRARTIRKHQQEYKVPRRGKQLRAAFDGEVDLSHPTPPTPSSRPKYAAMPGTPQKRRLDPRGLLLGTWKASGLQADEANAVYWSRDVKNRINRRISKESPLGRVVMGGNFNNKKTACKHADIDYLPEYQGMTNEEVNSHIMPLLVAGGGAYVNVPVQTTTPGDSRAFKLSCVVNPKDPNYQEFLSACLPFRQVKIILQYFLSFLSSLLFLIIFFVSSLLVHSSAQARAKIFLDSLLDHLHCLSLHSSTTPQT